MEQLHPNLIKNKIITPQIQSYIETPSSNNDVKFL